MDCETCQELSLSHVLGKTFWFHLDELPSGMLIEALEFAPPSPWHTTHRLHTTRQIVL